MSAMETFDALRTAVARVAAMPVEMELIEAAVRDGLRDAGRFTDAARFVDPADVDEPTEKDKDDDCPGCCSCCHTLNEVRDIV